MRLIPGKTKVKIEIFKSVTLADVVVGLVGLIAVTLCAVSSLPGRWIIAMIILSVFGISLVRIDDEPLYVFLWHMFRYRAYPRRYSRIYNDKALMQMSNRNLPMEFFEDIDAEKPVEDDGLTPEEKKQRLKEIIKEENKILKSKTASEEEKNAVWQARAERTAERKKEKTAAKNETDNFEEMEDIVPFTDIKDDFIEYGGKYYGAAIEIDPIEFRFFSKHRRNNSIESCFGKVLRSLRGDFGANIVKIQRPIMYDSYLDAEYAKLDALKKSYESGLLSEEELQARVEIQYERINDVNALCTDDKVIEPFYYFVLFDSDKRRLDVAVRQALMSLEQGELVARRLDTRGLAIFLKYTNYLDFDEKEIDRIAPERWASWAMPENLKFSMRRIEVNNIITHNMRVTNYPSVVGDAWMAGVMSFPGTKVVVKITPMDSTKAIRAIDHSLAELRGQYMNTGVDSKMIELREHIDTLSSLLVTLKQDNEALYNVNIYVTAYDAIMTRDDPYLGENFDTIMPFVADMKKTVKRSYSEAGMRLNGMDFLQTQGFIGSQISNYDPLIKEARGIPSNTIAGMFPWIFAHISDQGGIKLGSADGVPVFIDFFRRDSERVNSNMVIVGKSGSGKSYATKSLLSNLASEDAKIFILDPENEYSELAHNLHGKVINVGNAKFGRLNPFHIITALDDDEAGEEGGGPGGSFATHLQFLEEFFRQILPDIDKDALEYLNSLVERMYLNFGITPDTDLSAFTADDYPIFDDLYDVVLQEFERTNNEYLRQLLRSLVNYIAKFSTGGRNANIWNGPSTITTDENFSVFNFQSMLANRNTTIANAQMLLVLKYIDNEIIKNRDYNIRYGLNRKIVVVIDEAHVFIDTKFPIALDFMFQLAKRIRKYNGMQIVITQNIKDFVGSEEIARKSSAIINACQYSFVFGLAPNDMDDLCKLYAKAGGINEQEQEDILGAKRGQAFTIMSPTSRSSFMVEVPSAMVDMFENMDFVSNYFAGDNGAEVWEDFVEDSRDIHDANLAERKELENSNTGSARTERTSTFTFAEISEDEADELNAARFDKADEYDAGSKKTAMEKLMEVEEVVDRKEYEMAVGRFGGINFSEMSEDDYDSSYNNDNSFGGISFSEMSEDDYSRDYGNTDLIKPDELRTERVISGASRERDSAVSGGSSEKLYTQEYLDETLSRFKDSMREEMDKELENRLKWISLGAGLGAGQATGTTGMPIVDRNAAGTYGNTSVTMGGASGSRYTDRSSSGYEGDEEGYGNDLFSEDEEEFTTGIFGMEEESEDGFDNESDLDEYGRDYEAESGSESDLDEYDEDYGDDGFADESDSDEFDEDYGDDGFADESDSDEFDEDADSDEFESEDDEFDYDDLDDFYSDDDSEEYEPAPFIFAELLAEAAEEYANMDIEERMEEMGEEVIEVSLEELAAYVKEQRKKR